MVALLAAFAADGDPVAPSAYAKPLGAETRTAVRSRPRALEEPPRR